MRKGRKEERGKEEGERKVEEGGRRKEEKSQGKYKSLLVPPHIFS